ncbi:hypothetical protein [Bombiscardovia coagulans]|uniref:Glycosyl transferase n=1 Tax=Bombiscardovia coagulans TaxID=686666 RepID=A0A261EPY9_9BIFI|nr:hypothetical protein [Bombiscardovia coagulans]OZG48920.1 Glycosyl transferase [Bombiscardovia coagulans]
MSSAAQGGKQRVLITQSTLVHIGGSEVQAFELAQYLQSQGYQVVIYAWVAADPMLKIVEDAGIQVLTSASASCNELHLTDFDLVWVQHEVLPRVLIDELAQGPVERPHFIFSHMSPYREVHLEQPYMYGLEDGLADMIVFNAQGTLDAQQAFFERRDKLALYPNPAPTAYSTTPHRMRDKLEAVLIVSNHAPEELLQAAELLRGQGLRVDVLKDVVGQQSQPTSPELLDKYDCVVSIGKTVQYCLVQGVPVFLYDRFGGPGYLNEDNFERTAYFNFSGRSKGQAPSLVEVMQEHAATEVEPSVLAQQIVEGYQAACAFQSQHRERFIAEYDIDTVWKQLMQELKKHRPEAFAMSDTYHSYLLRHTQMVADYNQSTQFAADPILCFYQQAVRVFLGNSQQMTAVNLTPHAYPLGAETHLSFQCEGQKVTRVDFGEQPCLIAGLEVKHQGAGRLEISTNADVDYEGVYFFLQMDPQVYITSPVGVGQMSVRAQVFPLSHIPPAVASKLAQEIRHRQIVQARQLDRWHCLMNNPFVRCILRVRKMLQHVIPKR